jgi:NitT/TauT family transport system permease protein
MKTRRWTWFTTPLLIAAFVGAWKAYVTVFDVSEFILPPPEAVGRELTKLLADPAIWDHLRVTLSETLGGFLIAMIIGLLLGVVLGRIQPLERLFRPFIVATQVVPKVALAPLFIVWFGFGMSSKVVIAAILAFFPIFTNTLLGIRSVDEGHRQVMASLNSKPLQTFFLLDLRSALPSILAGMEVGIVLSVIGAVVGEYLGGTQGLGAVVVSTLNALQVAKMFAVLVLLTVMGFVLYLGVLALKRLLIPWHESQVDLGGGV